MAGKFDAPPPLPHEVLERVLRVSQIDGRMLLFIAGGFALVSAYAGDALGAIVGCCAAGAGALELHGAGRLRSGSIAGIRDLVRSQLLLLGVIFGYVGYQLGNFQPEAILSAVTPALKERFTEMGISSDQYLPILRQSYYFGYVAVALVSLVYQGSLALYYRRSRRVIARAFEDSD
ncbi:MAG: hypothetical protein HS122_01410 [Opitutaceae bacterium]|nr:hypothetical protein [Opitutaceae bacterium]